MTTGSIRLRDPFYRWISRYTSSAQTNFRVVTSRFRVVMSVFFQWRYNFCQWRHNQK